MISIFNVPDMHCSSCVLRLEMLEDTLPGIRQVTGSYRHQKLEIDYDGTKINSDEIIVAIKQQGYTAIPIP